MKIESAANAACVRGEIVCISPSLYQFPRLVLEMYLMRAQAAFAAADCGGHFVWLLRTWRLEGSSPTITYGRLSQVRR